MAEQMTAGLLHRYVRERGNYRCPVCGFDSFGVAVIGPAESANDEVAARLQIPAEGQLGGHVYYGINCGRCGHSDFFHTSLIDPWLASQ